MRSWWKKALGLLAGGLASVGGLTPSAEAQFGPPPGMGADGLAQLASTLGVTSDVACNALRPSGS